MSFEYRRSFEPLNLYPFFLYGENEQAAEYVRVFLQFLATYDLEGILLKDSDYLVGYFPVEYTTATSGIVES